jgi:hypothetical protein
MASCRLAGGYRLDDHCQAGRFRLMAGRVSSRMICRAAGRSMPAVPGTRACSPARQLMPSGGAGGEPVGHEGMQAARRGRRRCRAPCRMPVCGLSSCNGRGGKSWWLLMSAGRAFWLAGGRAGCRAAVLRPASGEYAGKSCSKMRLHRSKACRWISVKPSAKPTLVRTQHLPLRKTAAQR